MHATLLVRHNPPSASVAAGGYLQSLNLRHAYIIVSAPSPLHHPHVRQQMPCDEINTLSSLDESQQQKHFQLTEVELGYQRMQGRNQMRL
ncbi:hypothetical protein FIBSPDRAFT_199031 [Athelia psychrophila]|uniref:Uncharacterized protein n=1 Tax=Athelia psychrophila TaxID=1759441 RepID=A0A165ZPG6_9AGAM|nr:hypothetical protein FIBSPDRAFT_199031 [Fibularhizoctonia sp. CBS 109695]